MERSKRHFPWGLTGPWSVPPTSQSTFTDTGSSVLGAQRWTKCIINCKRCLNHYHVVLQRHLASAVSVRTSKRACYCYKVILSEFKAVLQLLARTWSTEFDEDDLDKMFCLWSARHWATFLLLFLFLLSEWENPLCLCVLHINMLEGIISVHDFTIGRKAKGFYWGAPCSQSEKCFRGFLSAFPFTELQPKSAWRAELRHTVNVSRLHFISLSAFISDLDRSSRPLELEFLQSIVLDMYAQRSAIFQYYNGKGFYLNRLTLYWFYIMAEIHCTCMYM